MCLLIHMSIIFNPQSSPYNNNRHKIFHTNIIYYIDTFENYEYCEKEKHIQRPINAPLKKMTYNCNMLLR